VTNPGIWGRSRPLVGDRVPRLAHGGVRDRHEGVAGDVGRDVTLVTTASLSVSSFSEISSSWRGRAFFRVVLSHCSRTGFPPSPALRRSSRRPDRARGRR